MKMLHRLYMNISNYCYCGAHKCRLYAVINRNMPNKIKVNTEIRNIEYNRNTLTRNKIERYKYHFKKQSVTQDKEKAEHEVARNSRVWTP